MIIEAESEANGCCWSGEFPSQYIEEITRRAGNFKTFAVFVKLLVYSLSQTNEKINFDLLSATDLELLRTRKGLQKPSSANTTNSTNNDSDSVASNRKKYVIITYSTEFDRVHFPLPLLFVEALDVNRLKRTGMYMLMYIYMCVCMHAYFNLCMYEQV